MGQQRYSFLSLMSIENDIVERLTVAYREKGERGDVPRHPRQRAGTPERGCITGALPFERGGNGATGALHNRIISNFMIYQVQFETNLLQLFAHT